MKFNAAILKYNYKKNNVAWENVDMLAFKIRTRKLKLCFYKLMSKE